MTAIEPIPGRPTTGVRGTHQLALDAPRGTAGTAVVAEETTYALIKARFNAGLWTRTETSTRPRGWAAAEHVRRMTWSEERRTRDSNPRGVAPNTLSKSAGMCPVEVAAVRDLRRWVLHGPRRTLLNSRE